MEQCRNGHNYDEANTYIYPKTGRKLCRACHRISESKRLNSSPENIQKNRDRARKLRTTDPEGCRQYARERKAKIKVWLDLQKSSGCIACPEKRLECLDFHHIDRKKKSFNIGMKWWAVSRKRLEAEVAKCQVLCANCHRFITSVERKVEKE
jgi:hypothetical protein